MKANDDYISFSITISIVSLIESLVNGFSMFNDTKMPLLALFKCIISIVQLVELILNLIIKYGENQLA